MIGEKCSQEEFEHIWSKVDKCKSTTTNVTVNKEALLHLLMDHSALHANNNELTKLTTSGRK